MILLRGLYEKMLKDDIGFCTSTTSKLLRSTVTHSLKPFNITAEQWTVLKQLSFVEHLTQKALAEKADKDQATLTKILDLLEKRDLVKRLPNPDDRRSYLIEITNEGRVLTEKVLPHVENLYTTIFEGISEEKLRSFVSVLQDIQLNVKNKLH